MKRILILSTARTQENAAHNRRFVESVQAQLGSSIGVSWMKLSDVGFRMGKNGFEAFLLPGYEPIKGYDLVYFKSYYRAREVAVTLVEYLQENNIPFLCSELANYISFSKLSQYGRLTRARLPIPETMYISRQHLSQSYDRLADELGVPFVLKATDAKGGDSNFLIKNRNKFDESLKNSKRAELVAQSFIENNGDMRLLVLNNKLKLVIFRQRIDNSTHLNNTSKGATARELPLDEINKEIKELAKKTSLLMGREIAGVDIMIEASTKKAYILEINASPQVASGALTDRKIALYTEMFNRMLQ